MTDDTKRPEDTQVHCQRLDRKLPQGEHAACPYCFGNRQQIAGGKHADFCDFKPGVDPIQFGFPDDSSRHLQG